MLILEIEYIGEIMKDSLRFKDVKKLILLANDLDKSGLHKEADFIDSFINKHLLKVGTVKELKFRSGSVEYVIPSNTTGNFKENGQEKTTSKSEIINLIKDNMDKIEEKDQPLANFIIEFLSPETITGGVGLINLSDWAVSREQMATNAPYILQSLNKVGYNDYSNFDFYVQDGKIWLQSWGSEVGSVGLFVVAVAGIIASALWFGAGAVLTAIAAAIAKAAASIGVGQGIATLVIAGIAAVGINSFTNMSKEDIAQFIERRILAAREIEINEMVLDEIKYILNEGKKAGVTQAANLYEFYFGKTGEVSPTVAPIEGEQKPPEAGAAGGAGGAGAGAGGAGAGAAGAGEVARRAPTERRTVSGELKLGSSGPRVSRLHNQLARLRYDIPSDEVSSQRFGNGTEAAVKRFQREQGLTQTGVVNAATQGKLDRALGGGGRTATEPRERVSSLGGEIVTIAGGEAGVYKVASAGGNVFAIVDRDPYRNNPRISTRERYQWAVKGAEGNWMIYNHKDRIFNSKGNRLRKMLIEREGRIKMQATTARRSRR